VNKASSLALLLGALVAALTFTKVSWTPRPQPFQHVSTDESEPVTVEAASAHKPLADVERPAPAEPAPPETTTIVLPSRVIREEVRISSQANKEREPLRLVRDLQRELKRVGCYAHDIDGEWTTGTRKAMKDFAERVNATLPVDRPEPSHLTLLQSHRDIVCRDTCRAGESLADNRCSQTQLVLSDSKKPAAATAPMQVIWTKSYVTPSIPEPDPAEAAPPPDPAPRAEAAPRPRRYSRPSGVGSLFFGIFGW
jgi:hypothetical protein